MHFKVEIEEEFIVEGLEVVVDEDLENLNSFA